MPSDIMRPEDRAYAVNDHLPLVKLDILVEPIPGKEGIAIFFANNIVPV
jgi:hypothetical protein